MTRISYIHGIGRDEIQDRAAEVKPLPYFNPMLMSEGQAYLTLMRDQVLTLAQYFPEKAIYRKGLSLIDNALYKGVNGITPAIGAVEPTLYPVMNAINKFKDRRYQAVMPTGATPAAVGSWASQSMVAGIGENGIPKPHVNFAVWWILNDPWIKATKLTYKQIEEMIDTGDGNFTKDGKTFMTEATTWRRKYDTAVFVVDLYNEKIEKFAHHPLYNYLPTSGSYPAAVTTKNILHQAGIQGCANAGGFSNENMSMWVRNGVLRENIKGGLGPVSPEKTAFMLTGLPESDYGKWLNGGKDIKPAGPVDRPGATIKGLEDAIGIAPAVIALIGAAIAAAASIAVAIIQNNGSNNALAAATGWGTPAFAAGEVDWSTYQQQLLETQQAGPAIPTPVLLGGAGLAAYLLLSK